MRTEWKIIFGYKLGSGTNAQGVYDALFQVALSYKFRHLPQFAIPISSVTLTDAIFGLNSHDRIALPYGKSTDGQSLKELFITTIFLKHLETLKDQLPSSPAFFLVLPPKTTSCDTAVMVSGSVDIVNAKQLRLPEDHISFIFQIKEYVNFAALWEENLATPLPTDVQKIENSVKGYSEFTLVFMRAFVDYESEQFKEFFRRNPYCYLLSVPSDIRLIPKGATSEEIKSVALNPDKHNYAISFPDGETFTIVSFDRPRFLVERKTLINQGKRGFNP